jgi:dihydroorotase
MENVINRRRFLLSLGAVAATQSLSSTVYAAMGPDDKFDLLIKGGDVLDPSQRLRGVRDIDSNGVI